jgi:virginiamycin A acetyltransferase
MHYTVTAELAARLKPQLLNIGIGEWGVGDDVRVALPIQLPAGCDLRLPFFMDAFSYSYSRLTSGTNALGIASVGRYCSIAPDVVFSEGEHPKDWLTNAAFTYDCALPWHDFEAKVGKTAPLHPLPTTKRFGQVTVCNDVWIGARAYIRGGVTLCDGAIIGTNAVVTKDVPPYAIVAGSPARIIGYRFPDALIDRLLRVKWWQYAYTDCGEIDWREPARALDLIEERKAAGILRPYDAPVVSLAQVLASGTTGQ